MEVKSSDCNWDKSSKVLHFCMGSGAFPSDVLVISSRTGDAVTFYPVVYDHPLFNEDYNDGEFAYYTPDEDCGVSYLVIYPANSGFYKGA